MEDRYEEALERAKKWYNAPNADKIPTYANRILADIFPELGESEDERVRKDITILVNDWWDRVATDNISSREDMLAWLEKVKDFDEQLEQAYKNSDEVQYKRGYDDGYLEGIVNAKQELEKQGKSLIMAKSPQLGEQKSADKVEPKFKVGDFIINIHYRWDGKHRIREITDGKYIFDSGSYINIKEQNSLELADKVEPKFKVGDKVRMKEFESFPHICTVEDVDSDVYYCDFTNFDIDDQDGWELVKEPFQVGNWYQCTKDFFGKGVTFDKDTAYYCAKEGCLQDEYGCHIAIVKDLYDNFKLWDIADAKDGDVLVDVYGNIGIYEKCDDFDWMSYCSLGHNGGFQHFKIEHENEKTYPATKEQRELLFREMDEAGYEWNPVTKELSRKEVSKKSDKVWSEEDKEMKDLIDEISCNNDDVDYETHVRIMRWLNELKQRLS